MGRFTEELARLGADISRSHQARAERLEEARDRTRSGLGAARTALRQQATARRKMATALHKTLRQDTRARALQVGAFLRDMRKTHFQRAKEARRERGHFVAGVQEEVTSLKKGVGRLLREVQKPVAEFGADFRNGAQRMHRAFQGQAPFTGRRAKARAGKARSGAKR